MCSEQAAHRTHRSSAVMWILLSPWGMLKSKINLRIVHVAPCRSTTPLQCSDPLEILDAAMRCPQGCRQIDPTVSKQRHFCYGLKANRVHPCENLKAALGGERNSATPNHDLARSDGPDSGGCLSSFKPPAGMPRSQHRHQLQRIEAPRPWNIPRRRPPAVAMDAEIFLATGVDRGFWNIAFLPLK